MHIVDCDDYTRKWYEAQGIQQAETLEIPLDPNEYRQLEDQKARQMSTVLRHQRLHADTEHAELVRRRFLELDRQVLRFYAIWDDRESLFGARHRLTLLYYLVDDTVEVVENLPRGGSSLLIARGPVPRRFRSYTHIEQCRRDGTYLSPQDLAIGAEVSVFGKRLLLYDCDDFTRRFYSTRLRQTLAEPISIAEPSLPVPRNPTPPTNGFGSEQVCRPPQPPRHPSALFSLSSLEFLALGRLTLLSVQRQIRFHADCDRCPGLRCLCPKSESASQDERRRKGRVCRIPVSF